VREPNPGEANYTHSGIDVFQDALREEDKSDRKADEQNARRTLCGSENVSQDEIHLEFPI